MCDEADILLTVKGSGCGKVAIAGVQACISRQLMAIRVPARALQYWFAVFQSLQEHFNRIATGGNIPGISRAQILDLLVVIPNVIDEMEAIGNRIHSINARWDSELLTLEKLKLEKAGLMDDLLTGRVRVTPLLETAT
jgi:type I restriction enzyme, S subunit